MPDIDVSVIVPCYNTQRYLDQALTSAEANDRCSLEIIVINDGSTDDSLSIMRTHERADRRVRVIDKENQGYGASVNRGIAEARGSYLTVLEPDDYVQPHMYDDLFEAALHYDRPDIVKSAFWRVVAADTEDEHLESCHFYNAVYVRHQPFTIGEEPAFLRHHPSIWSAIYRKQFLDDHAIRFLEVPGAGWVDNPFLVETLVQAASIVYINKRYYCYREFRPGSSSDITLSELPFIRWHNQVDILEQLGITDERIWEALYVRIFDSIAPAVRYGALDEPRYRDAIKGVCDRMDEARVHRLAVATPADKALYYQIEGRPVPRDLRAIFLRSRLKDFGRTLTYYGPGPFFHRVIGVLSRSGRRV